MTPLDRLKAWWGEKSWSRRTKKLKEDNEELKIFLYRCARYVHIKDEHDGPFERCAIPSCEAYRELTAHDVILPQRRPARARR